MIKNILNDIYIWTDWRECYKAYVPQFIKEAKTKNNWKDWTEDIFYEFFEKNRDQCVASLPQGYYTNVEKDKIKEHWPEIAPYLKKIAENQDTLDIDTYQYIKIWLNKFTSKKRRASANRLIASLQPNLLCTIVNEEKIKDFINKINRLYSEEVVVLDDNWFINSNNILNFFKNQLPDKDVMEIVTYPWQTYMRLTNNKSDLSNKSHFIDEINLLKYKKQIILQGPPGTGKTRQAKLMAKEILGIEDIESLNHHEQFKIVQFHPSYTYEDFVRGITAEGQNDSVSYKNVNKIFGKFAEEALDNYNKSQRPTQEISKEIMLNQYFEQFVDFISEQIEENPYSLTSNVSIISIDEDAFRYKGNVGWAENGNRMLFKDIKQAFWDNNSTRQEVKNNENLSGLARWHSSYYIRVVNLFNDYLTENNLTIENAETISIPQKDYILVIDEINRANLSSVLGELIYALEYRGEAVESMYAIDGNNKIILPPNLYIIGTMNTADRSVSQIDYAIRRRFAFVDVLPKVLDDDETEFNEVLFNEVATLFDLYLSNEFTKEQVQIGHSYFIDKSDEGASMKIRLEYEIKPILREYVRDGILTEEAKLKIEELKVSNEITQESDAETDGTPSL
ncbi:AAA family ATPase [Riemerella anatipestifer]|nr:AAA family ATPase [Riemerella anatipestifer]